MSDTFWGIILTGLFTLTASLGSNFLANRAHSRRLKREREMSLRTDIYLAAAEAAAAGLLAVGRFANLDITPETVTEGYVEKSPSLGKINIVASMETVRAVLAFSGELGATFLRLFVKRGRMVDQKRLIAQLSAQDEQARQTASTLGVSFLHEYIQFLEEVCDDTITLGRLLIPAVLSIRKELELPIDDTEFRRISEEANAKLANSLKAFIQQLRADLPGGTNN